MNTTPTTSQGEQAKNQLIAAALAQFGEYGLHATTRDIAAQAGQNIAAITYYFGSKEDLYLACAQWIADFIGNHFRPHVEEASGLLSQPSPDRAAGCGLGSMRRGSRRMAGPGPARSAPPRRSA